MRLKWGGIREGPKASWHPHWCSEGVWAGDRGQGPWHIREIRAGGSWKSPRRACQVLVPEKRLGGRIEAWRAERQGKPYDMPLEGCEAGPASPASRW